MWQCNHIKHNRKTMIQTVSNGVSTKYQPKRHCNNFAKVPATAAEKSQTFRNPSIETAATISNFSKGTQPSIPEFLYFMILCS